MGKTTAARTRLFGDVSRYEALLKPVAESLALKYNGLAFRPLFESLPMRSISLAPMLLCESMAKDLGHTVSDRFLQGIGMLCFHISTHDDLIDEPPVSRGDKAALLYAGSIAALESLILLQEAVEKKHASVLMDGVNENHQYQQRCIEKLWESAPKTFDEYRFGIEHDCVFAAIGVRSALALAGRLDLWPQLSVFCEGYGVAFQLIDDITEVREDKELGYSSYPAIEGMPYAESFQKIFEYLAQAEEALQPSFTNIRTLVQYPREFAEKLQDEYQIT